MVVVFFSVLFKCVKTTGMFYRLWWEESSNSDKSGCFSDDIICSGTHLLSVLTPMFIFTSWNELKFARASL